MNIKSKFFVKINAANMLQIFDQKYVKMFFIAPVVIAK